MADLFASDLIKKVLNYVPLLPDPMTYKEGIFQHSWDLLNVHALPPFAIIQRLFNWLLNFSDLRMTLMAIYWPRHEGCLDLLPLLLNKLVVEFAYAQPNV